MNTELFISFLVLIAFIGFATKRLLTYLHAFQQEEYDNPRFIMWMLRNKVFDKRLSALVILAGTGWFFLGEFAFIANVVIFLLLAVISYFEPDPRKSSKKKLAMTERAKRIYTLALIICIIPAAVIYWIKIPLLWLIPIHFIPFALGIANFILQPFEDITQKKFWNEAHRKLRDLNPVVIGVTGSYGKTSVKHILGHILSNVAPTLITPGSVNTPMGITRIIREQLDDTHKYFIAEMGAYGPGSIKRLCALAPPDFGIITAIGHAHYERFKTLETVAEAKFELAQATLAKNGKIIVHEKTLRFPYTRDMTLQNDGAFIVAGHAKDSNLIIEKAVQNLEGLEINVRWHDAIHIIDVPLFGLHHAENVAMAFAAACTLGLDPRTIINALKNLPQIPHRLEVKKLSKGHLIDDAYNSNPLGFRSALDLLFTLGKKRRKILITPGMVELGGTHDDIHKQIGVVAAQSCDICIVIQPSRIPTFIEGFKANARSDQTLYEMDTFAQAQEWINDNLQENDLILIENDLPDVYERVPKL